MKYNPKLECFRGLCERVSGYYLTERYPSLAEELSCEEVKQGIEEAEEFIKTMFGEG